MTADVIPFPSVALAEPEAITVERDGLLYRVGIRGTDGRYCEEWEVYHGLTEEGAEHYAAELSCATAQHLGIPIRWVQPDPHSPPDPPEAA